MRSSRFELWHGRLGVGPVLLLSWAAVVSAHRPEPVRSQNSVVLDERASRHLHLKARSASRRDQTRRTIVHFGSASALEQTHQTVLHKGVQEASDANSNGAVAGVTGESDSAAGPLAHSAGGKVFRRESETETGEASSATSGASSLLDREGARKQAVYFERRMKVIDRMDDWAQRVKAVLVQAAATANRTRTPRTTN